MITENPRQEVSTDTFPDYYVALAIPRSILKDWLTFKYQNIPELSYRAQYLEMNKIPHITIKYFDNVSLDDIEKVETIMIDNEHLLNEASIKINGLAIIGKRKKDKSLVGLVECSEEIYELRKMFDNKFPSESDLGFLPHVTIQRTPTNFLLRRAQILIDLRGGYESPEARVDCIYTNHKEVPHLLNKP